MLYKAKLTMTIPGDSELDAIKRLSLKLPPGWAVVVEDMQLADVQPEPVRGTGNITLPLTQLNGR